MKKTHQPTCYRLVFCAGVAAGLLLALCYRAAQISQLQKDAAAFAAKYTER